MPIKIFKTTADFISHARPFWQTSPIASNLQWGLATRESGLPTNQIMIGNPDFPWFGLQTQPSRPLVIVAADPLPISIVAEIRKYYPNLPGVVGTTDLGRPFAQLYATNHQEQMAMHTYALSQTRRTAVLNHADQNQTATSHFRLATLDDLDLLATWQEHFAIALKQIGGQVDYRTQTLQMIEQEQLFVYCQGKEIVTMAASTRRVGGVAVINYVFTPDQLRGKGYATACVGQLCDWLLQDYGHCMLYADKSNPASNAVYLKLGFEVVGQCVEILFQSTNA